MFTFYSYQFLFEFSQYILIVQNWNLFIIWLTYFRVSSYQFHNSRNFLTSFPFSKQILWWFCLCIEKDAFGCESSSSFIGNSPHFTMESQWTSTAFWGINSSGKWDYWYIWAVWGATLCDCHYSSVCYIISFSFFTSLKIFKSTFLFVFYVVSGDRTPKQKVKLKVTEEKLLNLMLKYNGGRPRSEVIPLLLG